MNPRTLAQHLALAASLALLVFALGCDEVRQLEFGIPASGDQKWGELNPMDEMQDQRSLHAQKGANGLEADPNDPYKGMMRKFAPEAVAADEALYPAAALENPRVAATLSNPVPITADSLQRGRDLYMTYCVVCHGEKGLGNGYVVPRYPKPPSLASAKLRSTSDGEIFHIITNGQNIMPHYRGQIRPMERWAIINYVRALQRAQYPEAKDLARVKTTN